MLVVRAGLRGIRPPHSCRGWCLASTLRWTRRLFLMSSTDGLSQRMEVKAADAAHTARSGRALRISVAIPLGEFLLP